MKKMSKKEMPAKAMDKKAPKADGDKAAKMTSLDSVREYGKKKHGLK